ncbi:MAG: class I SAM-dependent methyltransferase [bacterium]|nr:methyltransferase [Gammaproteobacteria bacterium]
MYEPIVNALQLHFEQPDKEPRRIFHGRGHMFDGLQHINIDWYPPVVLITAYEPIENLDEIVTLLNKFDAHQQTRSIVYQQRSSKGATSTCVWGEEMPSVVVVENGVRYKVQPGVHQNAGLFLDMRPLRAWLKSYSAGKTVLNLFAYTCSFSVAALAGDARLVVSVDMSKPSINWGRKNHELNGHDPRCVRSMPYNILKSWARIEKPGPYDTVVIDPPTRQRGSFDVERDYVAVLKRLRRFCRKGTDVFATINSPYLGSDYLPNLMQRYQPTYRLLGEFPASDEFVDRFPEKALKIYHFKS